MKLSDYMRDHNLTDAALAERIGRHRVSVTRYRNGRVRPDWDAMMAIEAATNGAVTPNDFIAPAPAEPASEGAAA